MASTSKRTSSERTSSFEEERTSWFKEGGPAYDPEGNIVEVHQVGKATG
jgi:hypothetical protein